MGEDTLDAIDGEAFVRLRDSLGADAPEFLAGVIDDYLADAPHLLARLQDAAARGDAEALRRAAHPFKSNSASFGAMRLAALCKQLEAQGAAGRLDGAAEQVAAIASEFERVRAALLARRPEV
jgi:HPt (histidine-containing phosphotransfer) domain-containing protein